MASFTNALIHSMTPFSQWLIQPMTSFTNTPFIQWPIHPMTHLPMPKFIEWPIHPMTHSPMTRSLMTRFTQWLIQPMPPFTMWCSASKERGIDCSMQHAACNMSAPQLTWVRKWRLQVCGTEFCVLLQFESKLYIWYYAFRCNKVMWWRGLSHKCSRTERS